MSFVLEARMDAIKRLSNEKRMRIEDNLENAKEKIERFSYKFTPGQYADWVHIINFYQMKLALDDLASEVPADSSSKMDNALEAVRLYHTSRQLRLPRIIASKEVKPDSPYVRTEIFTPCENCYPANDISGGAMLATLMKPLRPGEEHVGMPMIVHAQEYPEGALPPSVKAQADEDLYA
jgi:hypothetical protein